MNSHLKRQCSGNWNQKSSVLENIQNLILLWGTSQESNPSNSVCSLTYRTVHKGVKISDIGLYRKEHPPVKHNQVKSRSVGSKPGHFHTFVYSPIYKRTPRPMPQSNLKSCMFSITDWGWWKMRFFCFLCLEGTVQQKSGVNKTSKCLLCSWNQLWMLFQQLEFWVLWRVGFAKTNFCCFVGGFCCSLLRDHHHVFPKVLASSNIRPCKTKENIQHQGGCFSQNRVELRKDCCLHLEVGCFQDLSASPASKAYGVSENLFFLRNIKGTLDCTLAMFLEKTFFDRSPTFLLTVS